MQAAYYSLWIAHPVLQLSAIAAMWRRKTYKTFPIFFTYLAVQVAAFSVLFPVHLWASYATWFDTYWTCAAISLALGFKVIHEIFLDVFRPYHTLKDLGTVLFKWAALVMLMVAVVVAAASSVSEQGPLVQAVLTVQRCVRVTQCGLILFLLVFSKYLGSSWRQQSFGIALGFGFFASIELGMIALAASGSVGQSLLSLINMVAYNLAILTWLTYAVLKSPARAMGAELLKSQRWEQSLSDLQHPAGSDSLIPMFEGMVDRALSRTQGNGLEDEPETAEPLAHGVAASAGNSRVAGPKRSPSRS